MNGPLNTSLLEKGEHVSDNIGHVLDILEFLEETAFNYCSRLTDAEYGYSVRGWAGFTAVLKLARENLEVIGNAPCLRDVIME